MKSLRQSEPATLEFEGRTSEEAISRARGVLGYDAPIRCWRARKGGYFGFFARETFIAGLRPPQGAKKGVFERPSLASNDVAEEDFQISDDWVSELLKYSNRSSISDIADGTQDEVTLGSSIASASVFSDMLTEAESAIEKDYPRVDANCATSEAALYRLPSVAEPDPRAEFKSRILRLGIPAEYQPTAPDGVLDGLYSSLLRLPKAKPIPTEPGSLIVVVGDLEKAKEAARAIVGAVHAEFSDILVVEPNDVGRLRTVLHQSSNKSAVVVVEVPMGSHGLGATSAWISRLKPDYVLGAVSAAAKSSDVERWCEGIGVVDALAVSSFSETATPGEIMGKMPVALVEGAPATSVRWLLALLSSLEEHVS